MRPRASARWFGSVIAALSGLVLLLAVATPAASAGPAGSRGCGRRAACNQEQERLAALLAELLAAQRQGTGTPSAHAAAPTVHVHVKPIETVGNQPDTGDVIVVLRMTISAHHAKVTVTPAGVGSSGGGVTHAITTSTDPNSTSLLASLLGGLIGATTTVTTTVVQTTTGVLNSLLGVAPTPTPTPTRTQPGPPTSSGGAPPGQPSTGAPQPSATSKPRLQAAPLQGPSLPPGTNGAAPPTRPSAHHAGGVDLNPVSLLSSPSTAILIAAVAAFAVAVFGMVYSAGHRGRGSHRPRRAR